ncbi:hypothetical protein KCP70_20105 [Salmonella enterica subsp. enterica]|nr:hypothetical protein KCP70_20105 [Salmonella enterica subsp. enterica]
MLPFPGSHEDGKPGTAAQAGTAQVRSVVKSGDAVSGRRHPIYAAAIEERKRARKRPVSGHGA